MTEWIWMPHAAHLCVADSCSFRLATYVNGVIVSTMGEYTPSGEQDWKTIGSGRLYETMVFKARPTPADACEACAYSVDDLSEIDFQPYNSAKDAYEGHLALCRKWAQA
jgi:hypothetical protein